MIDTVKLYGNYYIDTDYIEELDWSRVSMYENLSQENGMIGSSYKYHKENDPLKVNYDDAKNLLFVEVSIPKYLYGHNLIMINDNDISKFFTKLDEDLWSKFRARPCEFVNSNWKVTRMDVCWNFQVGGEVSDYITAYSNIALSRYNNTITYNKNETVIWSNKSKRMQFYDKEKEVKANTNDVELINNAKGILRFEANITGKDLSNYSSTKYAVNLLTEDSAKYFLKKHLAKLGIDKKLTISNKLEIVRKLLQHYNIKQTQDLIGFISLYELLGNELRRELTPSTFRRRMDELINIGLAPIIYEKVLPPLELPFIG